jgi:hypothetical protein
MINDFSGKKEGDSEQHAGGMDIERFRGAGAQPDLPENIRAIQELFRPRFEAQDRRMEVLFAAQAAAEEVNFEMSHDLPVHEALKSLERSTNETSIFALEGLVPDDADERMEALAAAQFAESLTNARVTHDLPAEEALKMLEQLANGEIDWPV